MSNNAGIRGSQVINGSFGRVFMDGVYAAQFNKCEAKIEIEKAEIKPSGTRWTAHKVIGLKGSGTISGYKINSDTLVMSSVVASDALPNVPFELLVTLRDPEVSGFEMCRLIRCTFDEIAIANWEAQKETEEEIPFTFEDYELVNPIV